MILPATNTHTTNPFYHQNDIIKCIPESGTVFAHVCTAGVSNHCFVYMEKAKPVFSHAGLAYIYYKTNMIYSHMQKLGVSGKIT